MSAVVARTQSFADRANLGTIWAKCQRSSCWVASSSSLEGFQQTGSAERHFLRGIGCAHSDERIRIRQSFYQLREECGTLKDQPRDLIGLADGTAIAAAQFVEKRFG
jgi:ribulose kinase